MTIFDDWARLVTDVLQSESKLVGALLRHAGELGSAREALIRGILERIIPTLYELGSGQIVDHNGRYSQQIDVIIARRDVPRLALPSGTRVYLAESVVAAIEVKTELNATTLPQALDNCASVAGLGYSLENLDQFAERFGLTKVAPGDFDHPDRLKMLQFYAAQLPATYVIGFRGYTSDDTRFTEVLKNWAVNKISEQGTALMWFPSVVAATGVFAVRNADIYSVQQRTLCSIGVDDCPLTIFIRHLLYRLAMKIPTTPDHFGVRPSYQEYYKNMRTFKIRHSLFNIDELHPPAT